MSVNTCERPHQNTPHKNQTETLVFDCPRLVSAKAKLAEIIKERSFKKGDFTLASGQKSNYYIDCRPTSLSAEGSVVLGELFLAGLSQLGEGHLTIDAIGGMSMGADPLVSAVTLISAQQGTPIDGFLIRKEVKGHGTGKQVEGNIAPWMRVVLLEDVVTSGGSTLRAIQAVRALHPDITIAGVLAVVDRQAGGRACFEKAGVPFKSIFNIDEFL